MAQELHVTVSQTEHRYPIRVESGSLHQAGSFLKEVVLTARQVLLVTDTHVSPLYLASLCEALASADLTVHVTEIPPGEEAKTVSTLEHLYNQALSFGLKRNDVAVALGGGIVGDITGFFAATYLRGIAFVQVPTTLLAQVDASVGGKVAVNWQGHKNMIGAFHQPNGILIDPETLDTLPARDFACGMAEVVKYALLQRSIPDFVPPMNFLTFLETHADNLKPVLPEIIAYCCELKAAVVHADPTEQKGIREILNLGHTFAHAYETLSDNAIAHGEAVSIGMVDALTLAQSLGQLNPEAVDRVVDLLDRLHLPTAPPLNAFSPEEMTAVMRKDKKATSSAPYRLVLPYNRLGYVRVQSDVTEAQLQEALDIRS